MNYTVFDVETANVKRESICSIGIIRCEDDQIVYEKEILINPETHFDYYNTRIHGITEDMVKDAPTFSEIWPDIKEYFSNTVLVAHNAKSMDLCALYKTIDRYDLPEVHNEYICTYELSRQLLSEQLNSFKLNVLCNHYGISLDNHHNALCDTKACYKILLKLKEEFGNSIYPQPYYYNKRNNCEIRIEYKGLGERYSSKTKDMQELQDIVAGIIDDSRISVDEIDSLNIWLDKHEYLLGYYPFDKIYNTVENILEDGVMDDNEEKELLKLLDRFVNPETSHENVSLEGKKVCLSGEFDFGSKKDVEAYVTSKGGEIVKSVTKKTDVLIMGEAGSAAWKYGNYGSKYEKARQLKEKGSDIIVVKERDVIES